MCDTMVVDNESRYSSMMKKSILHYYGTNQPGEDLSAASSLTKIKISVSNLNSCNVYPHAKMGESYQIKVTSAEISISSNEIWGAIRGFETLSQSIFWNDEENCYIFEQEIHDSPEFAHRGFMIDTARH